MGKKITLLFSSCCEFYTEEIKGLCGSFHKCLKCGEICNTYKPNGREINAADLQKKYEQQSNR